MKERETKIKSDVLPKRKKKKRGFWRFYGVFLVILTVLSLSALIYVTSALREFEELQPDKMALNCAEEIKKAAGENRLDKVLSFEEIKRQTNFTDEEFAEYQREIADSELTVKKLSDKSEDGTLTYNIYCGGSIANGAIARFSLKSVGQKTVLGIFSSDIWQAAGLEAAMFSREFTLPEGVKVFLDSPQGEEVKGISNSGEGTVSYKIASIKKPEIYIADLPGNSVLYKEDGEYKFKEYKITIPTNFTLMGKEVIDLSQSKITDIDEYKSIAEYFPDMPKSAAYDIFVMENGEQSLKILDNNGENVDISHMGEVINITAQNGSSYMPSNIDNPPDPMEIAKLWSLFLTNDLKGNKHGFDKISPYLFEGTKQYESAEAWATGIDITFTSVHSLSDPPFTREEIGNFVAYGQHCFSCDILLEKPLHVSTGDLTDILHSRFYFGYLEDENTGEPHWGILDIVGIEGE